MLNRFNSSNGSAVQTDGVPQRVNIMVSKNKSQHVNKIVEKNLVATQSLSNNVLQICDFEIEETGYYHLSSQLCIKNTNAKRINIDFLQFGVCGENMTDYETNFNSYLISAIAEPEYVLSKSLTSIMRLEVGKKYCMWVNFSSDDNTNFSFLGDCSHLRLYKL